MLTVTRLDRPAHSTRYLLNSLAQIADKGAGFRSIADASEDTTSARGRLMLTVLGGHRDAGKPTREIARMFNVSHGTISRLNSAAGGPT